MHAARVRFAEHDAGVGDRAVAELLEGGVARFALRRDFTHPYLVTHYFYRLNTLNRLPGTK